METQIKKISILGSTGSIGTQALEVIQEHAAQFQVEALSACKNADLLIEQAKIFKPNIVVIAQESLYDKVFNALDPLDIKVYAGEKALVHIAELETVDIVLTALVGFVGLQPTIAAIKAGKRIALANKETLVVAGQLIMKLMKEYRSHIIPVDSEHSAIFQCLVGESHNEIEKIYLTASGGPFRGRTLDSLANVTRAEALKHPNWSMGNKITIDSATLVNKGLEVIEAKWLFGLSLEQIEVVVHPQSIIHSMVGFKDGSIKAQLGHADMKVPILYAFTCPERLPLTSKPFSFLDYSSLDFEAPDTKTFQGLPLAYRALTMGGIAPCIFNASNEVAVASFLEQKIKFLHIFAVIEYCLQNSEIQKSPSIDDLVLADQEGRRLAQQFISTL